MIEHGWSVVPKVANNTKAVGWHDDCKCGFDTGYHMTVGELREARKKHERDVEERRIWYVVKDGALQHQASTKRTALSYLGVKSGARVEPGTYAVEGGFLVTTDPTLVTRAA